MSGAPKVRPVADAPRDGRILRLLVDYSGEDARHSLDDASVAWTIGSNAFDNDGIDEWLIVGWDWSHDRFTQGSGKVIGWAPFHGEEAPKADDPPADAAEVRYFVVGDSESPEALTLEGLHWTIDYIWDAAAADGWIESIGALTVYEGRVISRAVETDRKYALECPVCCGGEIAEDIAEATGGEDCPNCEGRGRVSSEDEADPWASEHDCLVEYQMRPPLPPIVPGG